MHVPQGESGEDGGEKKDNLKSGSIEKKWEGHVTTRSSASHHGRKKGGFTEGGRFAYNQQPTSERKRN